MQDTAYFVQRTDEALRVAAGDITAMRYATPVDIPCPFGVDSAVTRTVLVKHPHSNELWAVNARLGGHQIDLWAGTANAINSQGGIPGVIDFNGPMTLIRMQAAFNEDGILVVAVTTSTGTFLGLVTLDREWDQPELNADDTALTVLANGWIETETMPAQSRSLLRWDATEEAWRSVCRLPPMQYDGIVWNACRMAAVDKSFIVAIVPRTGTYWWYQGRSRDEMGLLTEYHVQWDPQFGIPIAFADQHCVLSANYMQHTASIVSLLRTAPTERLHISWPMTAQSPLTIWSTRIPLSTGVVYCIRVRVEDSLYLKTSDGQDRVPMPIEAGLAVCVV